MGSFEHSIKKKCINLNYKILKPNDNQLKYENKNNCYHSLEKICLICGSKFSYGQRNKIICGLCKLIVECKICKEKFEYNWNNHSGSANKFIIESIKNNEDLNIYCSYSCSNKARHSIGICPNCGKENVNIYNGRCDYCTNKELNASINCHIHGPQPTSFAGKCIICHNQTKDMRNQAQKIGLKYGKLHISKLNYTNKKFCEICNKITLHNGFDSCLVCNPRSGGNIPSFKYSAINNCEKHKKCEIQYYSKKINEYICWECYKEEFNVDLSNDFLGEIKLYYSLAFIQSTFRSQESDNWNGSKEAFEQNLVEKSITWMAYVKCYISKNNKILPLVVGKTGSRLVNCSGTDVLFSMDVSHGPARKFLNETNVCWDKTKILVIPCETEEQALNTESKIIKTYSLFES